MPLSYTSIMKEHKAVRSNAGIFDVSHMGQVAIVGEKALDCVQRLVTNDASALALGQAQYTVMCNQNGGIVDDCIVYRRGENDFLIVINAANIISDKAWMKQIVSSDAELQDESETTALIAIQGPNAREMTLGLSSPRLSEIAPFHFATETVAGVQCMVARTGYTGEDGFEISCKNSDAVRLWNALSKAGAEPIGLGARDTLRLEARLCLYGNDIDATTSPYEAGLGWVVKPLIKDFVGKEALLAQKREGLKRKLVGFKVEGRGVPRPGYPILSSTGEVIGQVTSGTTGITVGTGIGLGYVPTSNAVPGTEIQIDCRGKNAAAKVVKGPFYRRP